MHQWISDTPKHIYRHQHLISISLRKRFYDRKCDLLMSLAAILKMATRRESIPTFAAWHPFLLVSLVRRGSGNTIKYCISLLEVRCRVRLCKLWKPPFALKYKNNNCGNY